MPCTKSKPMSVQLHLCTRLWWAITWYFAIFTYVGQQANGIAQELPVENGTGSPEQFEPIAVVLLFHCLQWGAGRMTMICFANVEESVDGESLSPFLMVETGLGVS